jgi:hypothetical protein
MPEQIPASAGPIPTKAPSPKPQTHRIRYYDLKKNWTKKIEPNLNDKELNDILVEDMNIHTTSCWDKPFVHGDYPCKYDPSDWRHLRRGRLLRYWKYVMYSACHWLVNFNLKLAMLAEPKRDWRIVTSNEHSTVWDGELTLFEMNFLALEIPAQECFDLAFENGRILRPGKFRRTNPTSHWTEMIKRSPN